MRIHERQKWSFKEGRGSEEENTKVDMFHGKLNLTFCLRVKEIFFSPFLSSFFIFKRASKV
jgi:hypothetical protein